MIHSYLVWFLWWLRHGAIGPIEATLFRVNVDWTDFRIYTFELVIRLSNAKQLALRFSAVLRFPRTNSISSHALSKARKHLKAMDVFHVCVCAYASQCYLWFLDHVRPCTWFKQLILEWNCQVWSLEAVKDAKDILLSRTLSSSAKIAKRLGQTIKDLRYLSNSEPSYTENLKFCEAWCNWPSHPILQTVREHRKLGGCVLQGFQAAPKAFKDTSGVDGCLPNDAKMSIPLWVTLIENSYEAIFLWTSYELWIK